MPQLVRQLADPGATRLAMLGYPNPRAALRVVTGCPAMSSVALVSPVSGFPERVRAIARRMQLSATLLSVRQSLWSSGLRSRYFPVVLTRLPMDATGTTTGVHSVLTAHLLEALRISTPDALLLLHLSVRVHRPGDQEWAARTALGVTQLLHRLGAREASLASCLVGPSRSTVDLIGWARRGPAT